MCAKQLADQRSNVRNRQVKHKGARRINFDQFVTALAALAEARGAALDVVVKRILQSGGPASNATRSTYVKFHDDKVGEEPIRPKTSAWRMRNVVVIDGSASNATRSAYIKFHDDKVGEDILKARFFPKERYAKRLLLAARQQRHSRRPRQAPRRQGGDVCGTHRWDAAQIVAGRCGRAAGS